MTACFNHWNSSQNATCSMENTSFNSKRSWRRSWRHLHLLTNKNISSYQKWAKLQSLNGQRLCSLQAKARPRGFHHSQPLPKAPNREGMGHQRWKNMMLFCGLQKGFQYSPQRQIVGEASGNGSSKPVKGGDTQARRAGKGRNQNKWRIIKKPQ